MLSEHNGSERKGTKPQAARMVAYSKRVRARAGQALVEYALIVVLVVGALVAILAAVGPALGNVFSNQVYNLLGQTTTPYAPLNATQFWNYVTAVASYTPLPPTFVTNVAGQPTATPIPAATSTAASLTPTSSATSTSTPTAGPSPTPIDRQFSLPFVDTGNTRDLWQYPFDNVWSALPWTRNWYNAYTTPGGSPIGSAVVGNQAYTGDIRNDFTGGVGMPVGVSQNGFYLRYDNADTVNKVVFEGRMYNISLVVGPNDAARFSIDGSQVLYVGPGQNRGKATWQAIPTNNVPNPAQSYHNISVEYWASTNAGDQHKLMLVFNNLADERVSTNTTPGDCKWDVYNSDYRSPPLAWQESPGNYIVGTDCFLRLRGYMTLNVANPRMTFWDKWNVGSGATTEVGIREYTWNGAGQDWSWTTIHGADANLAWSREFLDLKNINGINFQGKTIEFAFRMRAPAGSIAAAGWYVDDITIDDNIINTIRIEAKDDFDNAATGGLTWLPECNWARTTEFNRTPGGNWSYGDSPGANYVAGTDCSLNTNGVVDLTSYGGTNPAVPELDFWTQYDLAGTGTNYTVEIARVDQPTTWNPLTPRGSTNNYVAQGNATAAAWQEVNINLLPFAGNKWFFRFRLKTDTAVANQRTGVYIDDVWFRIRPQVTKGLPYYEPFNSPNDWTLGGSWALTSSTYHSSSTSLTDSPAGTYLVPSTGSTNTAVLNPNITLQSTTKPTLEFWAWWDTAATVNLYLESAIETDPVATFPTTLWSHMYSGGAIDNTNRAWQRIVVVLPSGYIGHFMSLRFRLEAVAGSTPADGIYVDDLRIWDDVSPITIAANPFYDNMENQTENIGNSTANWYAGGNWKLDTTDRHSGSKAWNSSPSPSSGNYPTPGDSTLEMTPTLDLTGVVDPVMTFWTKHTLSTNHLLYAELRPDNSSTWTRLNWVTTSTAGPITNQQGLNQGWTRNMVDLSAYVSQKIHLRFRLYAFAAPITGATMPGYWYLDDVYVGPRNKSYLTIPYAKDFQRGANGAQDMPDWTIEGDWQASATYGPWRYDLPSGMGQSNSDYGNGLNNQWNVDYYHFFNSQDPSNYALIGSVCAAGAVQIQPLTLLGGASLTQDTAAGAHTFQWSDGSPTTSTTGQDNGAYVTGSNAGIRVTVPADQNQRTLNIYVRWRGVITVTPTLSDGSATATATNLNNTGAYTDTVFTFTNFAASSNNATLNIDFLNNNSANANRRIYIRAMTLTQPTTVGAPSLAYTNTPGAVTNQNLTTEGTGDWTYYGLTSATSVDRKAGCVKAIKYQTDSGINNVWSSTNLPFPTGLATWDTDAAENEDFMVIYKRYVSFSAGNYRFWLTSDDGVKLLIDGIEQTPLSSYSEGYPFISAGTTPYQDQAASNYFYELNVASAAQKLVEVRYYQRGGAAVLRMQMASDQTDSSNGIIANDVIRSTAGTSSFPGGQKTALYLGATGWINSGSISAPSGGFTIPNGKNVRIIYYNRYKVGGTSSGSPDTFKVYYSIYATGQGDGTVWIPATVKRQQRTDSTGLFFSVDGTGNPVYETVTFGYNASDQSNNYGAGYTAQNWDQHVIDIANPGYAYTLNLKFEIDSRNNSGNNGSSWMIDNMQVVFTN